MASPEFVVGAVSEKESFIKLGEQLREAFLDAYGDTKGESVLEEVLQAEPETNFGYEESSADELIEQFRLMKGEGIRALYSQQKPRLVAFTQAAMYHFMSANSSE